MGYARYIGRVGALAVALGIGVALANGPATAWADGDDGSSSGSPSSTSDSSAGADSTSDTSGSAGSTGASSAGATGDVSVGADGGEDDAAKEDADDDESTDTAKSGADDAAARNDSTSDSGQPAAVRKGSRVSQRESVTPRKSEVKVRSEAGPSAKRSSAATTVSNTPTAGAGGTAPQAASVSETRRSVPISTPVRSADVVDVSAVSTTPSAPAKTVTTAVLSALGLSPLATGGPTDVPDSPVAWAMFAALRRQTDEDAGTEQKLLSVADPVAGATSVDGAAEPMMAMAAVAAVASAPVVGSPDQVSGAVLVGLNPVGPSGNPLTYTVTSQPVNGTVTVVGASATYTPSVASRLAAGSTAGVDFDSFTVSVADGQGGVTSTSVSVPVLPAVWANQASSSNVTGSSPYGVALVGDLAYVANQGTNTVTVINTKTGAVVGSPIVVGSAPTGVLASADGSKVFVTNRTSGTVSVIRTLDNTVVGSVRVGTSPEQMALNSTGTKLYVTNYGSSNVSVVDVSGQTPSLDIAVGANPRGIAYATVNGQPRVYVTRYNSSSVAVIDANTNMQIDVNPKTKAIDSITVGANPQAIVISPDGTRAYVTNFGSSSVSVINTATNSRDGAAISVGPQTAGVGLSSDGSLLYVANSNDTVSVINTKTRATVATLQIDSQPETNYHTLAVRSDGALVVTDLADRALRVVTYQRGNTAPVPIANPSVGAANPTTGAVSGSINIKDWDGDALTFTTVSGPSKGSVTFNAATDTYTYTPTQAARDAAVQTPATDTFTIRATDPYGAYKDTTPVTVQISPTSPSGTIPSTNTPIIVGLHPGDVVFSGNYAYVANYASGNVSVIDTRTNSVVDTVPIVGDSMAASADGTRLYVTKYSGVAIVDTATNDIIGSVDVPLQYSSGVQTAGSRVIDVAVDPDDSGVIYALRWYTAYEGPAYYYGSVSRIDTDTGAVTTVNTAYLIDIDVVKTPAGTRLYGGQYTGDVVKAYNAATLADVGTIDVSDFGAGSYVTRIATSPDGKRVYALVSASDGYGRSKMISVIDTATNREIATIADPSGAIDVSVSPDSKRVYVAQYDGRTTLVIDPVTNTVSGNFTTDQSSGGAQFVAEAPNGKVYVTDYDLRTVYAVNVGDTTPSNNVAPTWRGPTKTFNPATGVTTGNVNVGDGDGDPLRYYVSSPWVTYGTLTLDENTGDYVYTSYGTNDGYNILYEEAFTVVVTDSHYTTTGTIYVQTYVDPYSLVL
jgi:YVTN family beta-propeller protein